MAWTDVFAPMEAQYRAEVIAATWGHLAPKQNKTYHGYIIFAIGCFGNDNLNPTAIACEFKGLDSSPWFFDSLTMFLQNLEMKEGCVYRFDGTFHNYEFKATIRQLQLK